MESVPIVEGLGLLLGLSQVLLVVKIHMEILLQKLYQRIPPITVIQKVDVICVVVRQVLLMWITEFTYGVQTIQDTC